MLARVCSKSFNLGFSSTKAENFQMYKLGFKEAKEPEVKFCWTLEKERGFQKNIYVCFTDYAKAFDQSHIAGFVRSQTRTRSPNFFFFFITSVCFSMRNRRLLCLAARECVPR